MPSKSATLLLMLPLIAVLEGGSQPTVAAATPSPAPGAIGFLSIGADVVTVEGTRPRGEIKFPRSPDRSFNVDPMSHIASRVILTREPHASWIWAVLPYSFIGFFALACGGLAIDLRRQPPGQRDSAKETRLT